MKVYRYGKNGRGRKSSLNEYLKRESGVIKVSYVDPGNPKILWLKTYGLDSYIIEFSSEKDLRNFYKGLN
jgi:hypothetical protein